MCRQAHETANSYQVVQEETENSDSLLEHAKQERGRERDYNALEDGDGKEGNEEEEEDEELMMKL